MSLLRQLKNPRKTLSQDWDPLLGPNSNEIILSSDTAIDKITALERNGVKITEIDGHISAAGFPPQIFLAKQLSQMEKITCLVHEATHLELEYVPNPERTTQNEFIGFWLSEELRAYTAQRTTINEMMAHGYVIGENLHRMINEYPFSAFMVLCIRKMGYGEAFNSFYVNYRNSMHPLYRLFTAVLQILGIDKLRLIKLPDLHEKNVPQISGVNRAKTRSSADTPPVPTTPDESK